MGTSFKRSLVVALAAAASIGGCYATSHNDDGPLGGSGGGSGGAGGKGGKGGAASGGTSGKGGAGATGGVNQSGGGGVSAGTGGEGGEAGSPAMNGSLGASCIIDAQCGAGLICVESSDVATLGGAPAGGICTAACNSDDTCLLLAADAWCSAFEGGNYCLEGCLMDAGLNVKCHDRVDMVCSGVDFAPLGTVCVDNGDCDPNTACLSGECNAVLTLCLPSCGSDAGCSPGLFCDYTSGLCQQSAPTGKDFNAACDPNGAADECAGGICFETYDVPSEGTCSGLCNLGNPYSCGYDGQGQADSACLFGTILSGNQTENGDLGYCGQLCDCDDECSATGELCRPFDEPVLEELWLRAGYCVPIIEGGTFTAADAIGACAGGAGGASGEGGAPSVPPAGGAGGAP